MILTQRAMAISKQKSKKMGWKILAIILVVTVMIAGVAYWGGKQIFPLKHEEEIITWSAEYDVDPYLIMGIIRAESSFQADAVSHADAMGLMQITAETGRQIAQWLQVEDFQTEQLFDAACNIRFGTYYVSWLMEQFDGNLKNVLAAYNAGIGTVQGWLADSRYSADGKTLQDIPFQETSDFVTRVTTYQSLYRILYRR